MSQGNISSRDSYTAYFVLCILSYDTCEAGPRAREQTKNNYPTCITASEGNSLTST